MLNDNIFTTNSLNVWKGVDYMTFEQPTLLKNGHIIDVLTGEVYEGSMLVKNGIISKIYRRRETVKVVDGDLNSDLISNINSNVHVIDVSGKWLIPGLIDMHVHIKEAFAPMFVASGVTTVRNTGGNVIELRRLIEEHATAPTPSVYSADRIIDGPPGLWGDTSPWSINVDHPTDAIKEVRRQVEAGANFIKVYGLLSKEVMQSVVEEAKKYKKEVSCDLIYASDVDAVDAAKMGIKWNEHGSGIIQRAFPHWTMRATEDEWHSINWEQPDELQLKDVCSTLLEYDVIICPTMTLFDQQDQTKNYWKPENVVMNKLYENGPLIQQWEQISQYADGLRKLGMQRFMNQAIAKIYFDLGGTVVAGTDSPAGIWNFPGMSLHRELQLFVEAGFSELDAIRAATSVAAQALNRDDIGVLKEGAQADVLILTYNPLDDISNTLAIDTIIKGGKVYSQTDVLEHVPNDEWINRRVEEFMKDFKSS